MATKKEHGQDELEGVEQIPKEQAEHEIHETVEHVKEEDQQELHEAVQKAAQAERHGKKSSGSSHKSKAPKDELDEVEAIPKEQAIDEMRAAAEKARKAQKNH